MEPQTLLEPILARLGELWQIWEEGRLEELLSAWSERDICRGHRVRLLPDGPEGVANGIDRTGALKVLLADGREERAFAGALTFLG